MFSVYALLAVTLLSKQQQEVRGHWGGGNLSLILQNERKQQDITMAASKMRPLTLWCQDFCSFY